MIGMSIDKLLDNLRLLELYRVDNNTYWWVDEFFGYII